jgi:hypothetical protein
MSHVLSERELEHIEEQTSLSRSTSLIKKYRDNQMKAAEEILNNYTSKSLRVGLLKANEQVGKSGTYHYLIELMFERMMIDNVYILCGSQEVELRRQCEKDILEYHSDKPYVHNIHVIFRQNFNKNKMNTINTLIINDESHLVQDVDQTLEKFLNKHNIIRSAGTDIMSEHNMYMLSVDATPYAEEAAIVEQKRTDKFKVTLEDGEGYFGVKEYYEAGLIKPTFKLDDQTGKDNFLTLLKQCKQKYALVRIQSSNKQKKLLVKLAREAGCDIVHFTSHFEEGDTQICITKADAIIHFEKYGKKVPSLEEAPKKTTVVIIDGRLRCGKRVPKKYIGFVWESAVKPKTDVIRQGLLGRMCGYLKIGCPLYIVPDENKPLIFIPDYILKKEKKNKIIELSDLERSIYPNKDKTIIGPRYGNNLIPGFVQTKAMRDGREVSQCVPIRCLPFTEEEIGELLGMTENKIRNKCLDYLRKNLYLINGNTNLTPLQKEEILIKLEHINKDEYRLRRYRDESNQNMHKCQVEGYLNRYASKEGIYEKKEDVTICPFLTFCVVHPGFKQHESVTTPVIPGEVYVIFYTKEKGFMRTINVDSRISKVNKLSAFISKATDEVIDTEGCTFYGFDAKIRYNSDELHRQFNYFIKIAKENIGTFGKTFTALGNGEYITLPRSIYGNNLEKLNAIFRTLEADHNVKITYQVKKRLVSSLNSPDIELKYISWE